MPGIFTYLIPFNLSNNEVYTIISHFTNEEAGKFFKKQTNKLAQNHMPRQARFKTKTSDSKTYSLHFTRLHLTHGRLPSFAIWTYVTLPKKKKKNRLDYHSIFISLNIHFKWIDGFSKCPSFRLYLIIPFPQSQSLHRQEADMAGSTVKSSERKPGREEARLYILWAHRRPPLRKEFFLPMRFSFPQVILEFLFTNS